MDDDSESLSLELHQSTVIDHVNGASAVDHSDPQMACVLCQRILSPDNESENLEAISLCGDCKFLYLEEFEAPTEDTNRRRSRVRRTRQSSSESIENFFSQQFSHIINMARQSQPTATDNQIQSAETDMAARFMQRTHSHNTPSGSRRWRVVSDTESEGFDSLYGETESNISISGYRAFQSESDVISFSAYGGDSDASVDGRSFPYAEMFTHPDAGSDLDSDTDIDPMHAGLNQWNTDDQEEEEEEEEDEDEDNEWEEVDAEGNAVESLSGSRLQSSIGPSGSISSLTWRRQLRSAEFERAARLRIRERRQTHVPNMFINSEEPETLHLVGDSGDYLDARGFSELLEHLAEADDSRRGAPPAAVSFVNCLPRVIINEEHEKQDCFAACAICKDFLSVGTVVNQLPCFHLYHPSCILPWLSARNSCPLCRYELPTDDKDYEERKQSTSRRLEIHEIQLQEMSEDSSSDSNDGSEADRTEQADFVSEEHATRGSSRESARGRWFFLAAAPIVSLVGIVVVLWLGHPQRERRGPVGHHDFPGRGQHPNHSSGSWAPNQRENRSRRWWYLF